MFKTKTKIVLPILNKRVITFKGPTWFLAENIYFDTVTDEDFGTFHRELSDEYKNLVSVQTKCFYIMDPAISDIKNGVRDISILLKFLLNTFSFQNPIIISFGAFLITKRKTRINTLLDLESDVNYQKLKTLEYRLGSNTTREEINIFFTNLINTCKKDLSLYLTLDRFNRSFTRSEIIDKIIDLTICLESLLHTQNEVKFKFALYNSIISSRNSSESQIHFKLLGELYDIRSSIVHGSSRSTKTSQKIDQLSVNIPTIFNICKRAINYKLLYESEKREYAWQDHLKRIIFNPDEKIIK